MYFVGMLAILLIFVHNEEDRIGAVVETKEIVVRIRLGVAGGMEQKRHRRVARSQHAVLAIVHLFIVYFTFVSRIGSPKREFANTLTGFVGSPKNG